MTTAPFTRAAALVSVLLGLAAWACLACGEGRAADAIPVADFFRAPTLIRPVMSPSGAHVAALLKAGAAGRLQLAILDLSDLAKSRVIAGFYDADIAAVHWVNDDRLVFSVTDRQSAYAQQQGEGLFSVDREGKEAVRRLIKRRRYGVVRDAPTVDRELSVYHRFFSTLQGGSNDVIVAHYAVGATREVTNVALLRVDTVTGRARSVSAGAPAHTMEWAVDTRGEPRAAFSEHEDRLRLYLKATPDAPWNLAYEAPLFGDRGKAYFPLGVDANDVLYFRGYAGREADTLSLMRLDMRAADAKPQELISLKGYDFDGRVKLRGDGLFGADYLTDGWGAQWFDPALRAVQERVDKLLPATNNLIDCGDCAKPATVLVTSQSDRQPPVYYLYAIESGRLERLGASRPWIDPRAMAQQDMLRISARDGLEIPVHVTRPPGVKGAAPMVVLVHGGPYMRGGEWHWDVGAQFLASRGYVVVEPEFRGSTGFGFRLFRAGWKQWGLKMQDDVTDAAQWAIRQGYANPQRICIAGASYGGYAVLMGLIREPALFRCGVEWVGVTDIDLLYSIDWSDFSGTWKRYGMPTLIGDRQADAAQFAATSPLRLAAKLGQPLLMAYGGEDQRVPIEHGTRMRDALRAHNDKVEWISYDDEGHGWMLEANRIDFWTRVDAFLDKNLRHAP